VQSILWANIEDQVEALTFRLNDTYFREFVPKSEQLNYLRFKERKFGKGCIQLWTEQRSAFARQLAEKLLPFEQMLATRPFLLDRKPRFVDFDLWGMLANFQFSGHYTFPASRPRLKTWYNRMTKVKFDKSAK
jgi:glutathione S-transferase